MTSKEKRIVMMRFHIQRILHRDFYIKMTQLGSIFGVDHSTISSNIQQIKPIIRDMVALSRETKEMVRPT